MQVKNNKCYNISQFVHINSKSKRVNAKFIITLSLITNDPPPRTDPLFPIKPLLQKKNLQTPFHRIVEMCLPPSNKWGD